MRMRSNRVPWLPIMLLVAWAAFGLPASAGPTSKPYLADIDSTPEPISVGATVPVTASFTNQTSQQQLGSFNLTAPAGFQLRSVTSISHGTATLNGNRVEGRNIGLAPGGTVTVGLSVTGSCSASTGIWTAVVKQANNFSGSPGNDLSPAAGSDFATPVTGACHLAFLTQPANTEVDEVITAAAFDPAGPSIEVAVLDEANDIVTSSTVPISMVISPLSAATSGSLHGTTTRSAVAGVAPFDDLTIDASGLDYRLRATSPGLDSADSTTFDVMDLGTLCPEGTCVGELAGDTVTTRVVGNGSRLGDQLSIASGVHSIDCAGYGEVTETVTYDFTGLGTKVVTSTIPKRIVNQSPDNGAAHFQTCFGSPEPFATRSGGPSPFDPASGLYVGLLPDCGMPPCVHSRHKTGAGIVVVTYEVPAGDPAGRH
jgi:hypothetical protein